MKVKIDFIDSIIDFDNSNVYQFYINNNKYYYISNNTKSYNVYISKIYDYNEEDMLVFNPMEYNIDIEKFLDIINNVKFKENKDADYYIIQK